MTWRWGASAPSCRRPREAKEALAAGADLLLICNDWQAAWETARLLAADGSLARRGRESAARLDRLRQSLRAGPGELRAVQEYLAGTKLNPRGQG